MADVTVELDGNYPLTVKIGEHEIRMDVSERLGGTGSAPSPTDFFIASVVACKVVYAKRFADRRSIDLGKIAATCQATRGDSSVEKISVRLDFEREVPQDLRAGLDRMVTHCYVADSIANGVVLEHEIG